MNKLKLISLISILLFTLHSVKASYGTEELEDDLENFDDENIGSGSRNGRFFWLFDGIKKGTEIKSCTSGTSPNQIGHCESQLGCKVKNGESLGEGTCQKGVCCRNVAKCSKYSEPDSCVIRQTGVLITRETGTGSNRVYVFPRIKGACQVRLDFDYFEMIGTDTGVAGECEQESLTVFGSPTVRNLKICGNNTGQHMYLEYGSVNDIRITLNLTDLSTSNYAIRPTFIKCNSARRVPGHCLQYFTAQQGRVLSFNNNLGQLNTQDYNVCVKPLDGTTSVTWKPCTSDGTSFSITGPRERNPVELCTCSTDWVAFSGDYCKRCAQGHLPTAGVQVNGKPFFMTVHFDRAETTDPMHPFWTEQDTCGWWSNPDLGMAFKDLVTNPTPEAPGDPAISCVGDASACQCDVDYALLVARLAGDMTVEGRALLNMLLNTDRLNTGFCLEYSQSQ